MAPNDLVGWVAASFVLATFCAKRMATLRSLAIASNIAFVAYAYAADLWPILVLHSVMLPINAIRLREALYSNGASIVLGNSGSAGFKPVASRRHRPSGPRLCSGPK